MFIKRLHLKKLLSFNDAAIELGQLNVLIGANAVGKSNLIEVISLLQSAPTSLAVPIMRGGGVKQYLWLGDPKPPTHATIECEMRLARGRQVGDFWYELRLSEENGAIIVPGEELGRGARLRGAGRSPTYLSRAFSRAEIASGPKGIRSAATNLSASESALSLFKNPADPNPITDVGRGFAKIRIFREFRTGLGSGMRVGVGPAAPKDVLADGGDNLAIVLHELDFQGVHERIRAYLRRFCERFEDVKVNIGEGLLRTYLQEAGLAEMVSALRMSDGTLKFLALLAALFNPKPPPLMCIEEPEVGLHPDAVHLVAEALLEASETIQLIVTTHSEALVDSLTDKPESVLVCERDPDNGTQMKRLSKKPLKAWLAQYTLGRLWRKGVIGGGRW